MRILVLGGTSFVGRAVVEGALSRGHQLTVFNRGRTGADPLAVELSSDRETQLLATR